MRWFSIHRLSLGYLGLMFAICFLSPPFDPNAQDIVNRLQTPSMDHWFGTDMMGRDLWSRVMDGTRYSLWVGVVGTLGAILIGTLTGGWAGLVGGRVSQWILAGMDLFYIFPSLLLSVLMVLLFGQGLMGVTIAIVLSSWVTHARLMWSVTRTVAAQTYVESAVALGRSRFEILRIHVLPQLWGPIRVSCVTQIPQNILTESFLSFIGLGLQSPFASWGTLANDGFKAMQSFPHLILGPGLILFFALLSFQGLKFKQGGDFGRTVFGR